MSQSPKEVDVSIIVANWNTRELLRDCIRSIYGKTKGIRYELIIADDASTDGSAEIIQREFPQVKIIQNEKNLGYAKSINRGVPLAQGNYILLLNSDTLILDDAIKILANFLDLHPEAGVCGGWLWSREKTSQISYGSFPSLPQAFVDAFFLNDLFPSLYFPNRGVAPDGSITHPVEVDYVTGAAILIRKKLIEELGLFDERFEAYCEEVDFCYRVTKIGKQKVYFLPDAKIIHLGGASYGKLGKRKIQIHYSSYDKFLRKYHGGFYSFVTRLLYAWHYMVKMIVRLVRYLLSTRERKQEMKNDLLDAWYIVLYSLAPNARPSHR